MNHKVLLAEDSLTIQKIIKITLANQPYDITEVSTEEELFQKLSSVQPKLVFLDFNLSEKYSGYELTTKIKSLSPSSKVLLLHGTFDNIDDQAMEKSGASDKIVKPFDSNKFIAICKQLIDTFADDDLAYPDVAPKIEEAKEEDSEDQWTVSHSTEQSFPVPSQEPDTAITSSEKKNALHKEVSDWGMSVPGVIDQDASQDDHPDIPPVISEVKSLDEHRTQKSDVPTENFRFPESSDLDYPTIEELQSSSPTPEPKSKLLSIDDFGQRSSDLELESNYVADESDVRKIEDQIKDEVEEDLWQADEFEDLKKEVSSKIEEVQSNFKPSPRDFDESLFKPIDDPQSFSSKEVNELTEAPDLESLRGDMEEMVKKYVKEYLDELFQKNSEKVAWEVIPDLAENLIRQELSKISDKIGND